MKTEKAKATVLVVDDNPDMRMLIEKLLGREYTLLTAENGREGLGLARSARPDLILMDVLMPEMNGYEATRELKKDPYLQAIPVVMLTARTETESKLEGLQHGADDYIAKPFDPRELIARVASLIRISEYRRLLAERNRIIESELDMARELQHKLLPGFHPQIPGLDFVAQYIPMDKVGGDFFDFIQRPPQAENGEMLGILLADVSGHGIPGAFFSAVTKMAFQHNIGLSEDGPALLGVINETVLRYSVQGMFLTALYVRVYPTRRKLYYTLAGQTRPLLYRRRTDEMFELYSKGFPIGIASSPKFQELVMDLDAGDRIVLYTDGVTEIAGDISLFGDDGLKEFVREHRDLSPDEFTETLLRHLRRLTGGERFYDDVTLIVFDVV